MDRAQMSQGYRATRRRQFTFYHSVARSSWYSFNQPQKDERLRWPQSHPEVLNPGPLDWESSTLTARSFPKQSSLKKLKYFKFHMDSLHLKFTKIWQTFTHTKESQKTCFLYAVILIFTSNHICTLQRYMKPLMFLQKKNFRVRRSYKIHPF